MMETFLRTIILFLFNNLFFRMRVLNSSNIFVRNSVLHTVAQNQQLFVKKNNERKLVFIKDVQHMTQFQNIQTLNTLLDTMKDDARLVIELKCKWKYHLFILLKRDSRLHGKIKNLVKVKT